MLNMNSAAHPTIYTPVCKATSESRRARFLSTRIHLARGCMAWMI